ncbi:MAG: cell division protein ZapA [Clostridiales bacterium]|nr:cell division protein ZapA [Clostridiales bacterium]
MKDKLNITIRIADQPPIPLNIRREEEEIIRQAEKNVNRLWYSWSERFNTSNTSILAMVAFQFAKLHASLVAEQTAAAESLNRLNAELDQLLGDTPTGHDDGNTDGNDSVM